MELTQRWFARRGVLRLGAAVGALAALSSGAARVARADPLQAIDADAVYFEETGHTVSGPFWRYWRQHGLDAFGFPVSEPFEDGGVLNQYFQRARFELASGGAARLGLLGVEAGGAAAPPDGAPPAGARVAPETGHSVNGAFLAAHDRWRAILGPPVGPEQPAGEGYVQYFANARLEWDPAGGTRLGLLGAEIASRRGVDLAPVPRPAGTVTFGEYLAAWEQDEAARRAFGGRVTGYASFAPGFNEKWVLVSIAQQRVTAYEGTTAVFSDLTSTGAAHKGLTPRGIFAINRRVPNETMDSTTIGYPRGHPKYYRLENVLYTQYFDNAGTALHYAWWHNNFGNPMSYGCVNLRLSTARWFWDWATFGTRVVVA